MEKENEEITKKEYRKGRIEDEHREDLEAENLQHANKDQELPKKKIIVLPKPDAEEVD